MTFPDRLAEDEDLRERASREFTLRAIRRGADHVNHWILQRAYREESVPVDDLASEVGLTKVTVSERVNDLVQVGLLERNLEGDRVQPTVLTAGFLGVVDDVTEQFADKLADGDGSGGAEAGDVR